jgi:hypothetical protein
LLKNAKPFKNKELFNKVKTKTILKRDLEPLSNNKLFKVLKLTKYF